MFVRVVLSAFIILCVVFNFFLPEATSGTRNNHLKFESGWLRVTSSGHPMTAGYITISNNGSKDVVLMSVSSTVAKMVELHETTFHNNVMKMRKLKNGIKIPANGMIHLKPKGLHLMFRGLKKEIKEEEKYKVKFIFMNGSEVEVSMSGKKIGTKATTGKHKH
tara:strand:- start:314 stop:802 length:489 start_codon:yes stop_codon:yes gene_type:complete